MHTNIFLLLDLQIYKTFFILQIKANHINYYHHIRNSDLP